MVFIGFTAGLIVGAVVATVLCAAWAYDAMQPGESGTDNGR